MDDCSKRIPDPIHGSSQPYYRQCCLFGLTEIETEKKGRKAGRVLIFYKMSQESYLLKTCIILQEQGRMTLKAVQRLGRAATVITVPEGAGVHRAGPTPQFHQVNLPSPGPREKSFCPEPWGMLSRASEVELLPPTEVVMSCHHSGSSKQGPTLLVPEDRESNTKILFLSLKYKICCVRFQTY